MWVPSSTVCSVAIGVWILDQWLKEGAVIADVGEYNQMKHSQITSRSFCVTKFNMRLIYKRFWTYQKKTYDNFMIINKRLSNAWPPYDITRTPSSLLKLLERKGSEFRTFVLYYFSVLEGILPEPFYSHFCNLSYALYIVLQESVETDDMRKAGIIFTNFVWETELLDGSKYVTYNFHLLEHIEMSVLHWGCLWANSAIIPEWFNGQL